VDSIAGKYSGSPFWQVAGETDWHLLYRPRWNMVVFTPEEDSFNKDLIAVVRQGFSDAHQCGVAPPVNPPHHPEALKVTISASGH
jgi:hypothetical protein